MDWLWAENSILNNYSLYTPCKNIFQAVCDELGRYYEGKGFKYCGSRPKITYKNRDIKLEISFWSSGYNIPGKSVLLEIIPSFFSLELVKNNKEKGKKNIGYILGHPEIFVHSLSGKIPGTIKVQQILDEDIERNEEWNSESELKVSNCCDVYGITVEKFIKIINFIDSKIIYYLDVLKDYDKLEEFIQSSIKQRIQFLERLELKEYIEITFPDKKNQLIDSLNRTIEKLL